MRRAQNGRVEGKVAIVTGAALGIGRAIAERLAMEGAKVVLTDINMKTGPEVASSITQAGGAAHFVVQDVSSEGDWRQVLDETAKAFGQPDILVNNAGIYMIKPMVDTTVEEWRRLMDINALGVFLGMKHCAPAMVERRRGSIVNLSSVAGIIGALGHVLYGASKGAVRTMTKDAAVELAQHQVRVNSIHPAYIETNMAEMGARESGRSKEELGRMHPIGHMGEPADVANAALFLASDESKFITGAELVLDGGLTAQ